VSITDLHHDLKAALDAQHLGEAVRLAVVLGDQYASKSQSEKALDNYTLGTRLCQELGDVPRLVECLEKLSATYLALETPDKAIIRLKRALELSVQIDNTGLTGRLWALLGDAHQQTGKMDEAHVDYEQAVKHLRSVEDWIGAGIAGGKRAAILLDLDKVADAIVALGEAVALFETGKRRDLQARALGNLGTAFGRLGRWGEAGKRHNLALNLARESGDQDEEAYQLRNLGYVAEMDGHFEWAVMYYRQALYLAILNDDRRAIARLTVDIARLLVSDDRELPQSIILLETAIGIRPDSEAQAMLDDASQRHYTLSSQGIPMNPPITDLKVYAQQAYRPKDS
jgi:tetratricopeptide (TPR) repeat protein